MPTAKLTVTFDTEAKNAFDAKDKEKFIKAFNELQGEHQARIFKLMSNPKALKGLKDNWSLLENMFL